MNSFIKTVLLLGLLSVIIIMLGGLIGGQDGVTTAFIFSLLMNGAMYFFSDKVALSMSRAQPLDKEQYASIYVMVEELAKKMAIPMPTLYITPDLQANAFATGRGPGHASVAMTRGILQTLPTDELRAVLAHELSHIKNRDVLIATTAAVLASTISFLANMSLYGNRRNDRDSAGGLGILLALLVPVAGAIIQMAISREREFGADEKGAKTIGSGLPLAQALRAISGSAQQIPMHANPALASLYIGDPTGGIGGRLMNLFSTHPPLEERIKRLQQIRS